MFNLYVILIKVPLNVQESASVMLGVNGATDNGSTFDVCFNKTNGYMCIDFSINAETLQEAINDVTYELNGSDLLKYMKELGVEL